MITEIITWFEILEKSARGVNFSKLHSSINILMFCVLIKGEYAKQHRCLEFLSVIIR